jgi:hypothetical protein
MNPSGMVRTIDTIVDKYMAESDLTFAWGDGTPIVDLPGADGDDDDPTYQSSDAEADLHDDLFDSASRPC